MNRIKELRLKNGMKQSDLAHLLNVKDAAISKYENEKIPLTSDTILLLSKIFRVSTDYLLGISENSLNSTDLEWRYPPTKNRFGEILFDYRNDNDLSESDFAKKTQYFRKIVYRIGKRNKYTIH